VKYAEGGNQVRISRRTQDIRGFEIISSSNGEIIGELEDVYVDLEKRQIAAIVTTKRNPLVRSLKVVHRDDIKVWGEDVILVSGPDVVQNAEKLNSGQNWELAGEKMKGKDILNTKGDKIAELGDVIIDSKGLVLGYDLSEVSIEGPIQKTKRVHIDATQAFGKDALIIDVEKLYNWEI
jgi:uncharacterized protein YrrD